VKLCDEHPFLQDRLPASKPLEIYMQSKDPSTQHTLSTRPVRRRAEKAGVMPESDSIHHVRSHIISCCLVGLAQHQ
jgi:hypothetical protein